MSLFGTVATLCTCLAWTPSTHALTLSIGEPYRGRLVNGVPFPTDMGGYIVRDPDRAYATPELIGSLLDAIDSVREKYPNTVDLFIGDFSAPGGGRLNGHKSHQNGRDVDLGMYAIGNQPLDQFIPMHAGNLDVPKTWSLIEALIRTGRVQYLFVDRKIQRMLFEYALSRGFDEDLLNRLFNDVGPGSTDAAIRHEPRHNDHIHVRFYAPWSSLAGQMDSLDPEKKALIELAQAGFLPKKVLYYVDKRQTDIAALARSFGVRVEDLVRWNHLNPNMPLTPGTPLVYYRRAFEVEPVHLAESLRPRSILPPEPIQVASVGYLPPVDVSSWARTEPRQKAEKTHTVRRGETPASVARAYGLSASELCRMNSLSPNKPLKVGSKLVVGYVFKDGAPDRQEKGSRRQDNTAAQDMAPPTPKALKQTPSLHVVKKGDTLFSIAQKYRVSPDDLREWNKLSPKSAIRVGSSIMVSKPVQQTKASPQDNKDAQKPSSSPGTRLKSQAAGRSPLPSPKDTKKTETPRSASSKGSEPRKNEPTVHTVAPGESLWAISKKYNVDVQKILTMNKLNNSKEIKPGVRLKIPENS
ncbi:MAG: penicillin-insensitive murein endopeptidase [Desulfosoma sp.]